MVFWYPFEVRRCARFIALQQRPAQTDTEHVAGEETFLIWAACALVGAALVWRGSVLGRAGVHGVGTPADAVAARVYVLLGGVFLLFAPIAAVLVS